MFKSLLTSMLIECIERGWMHDGLTRRGIRYLCGKRLQEVRRHGASDAQLEAFVRNAIEGPIAPLSEKANEQHYEIPAEFFQLVLGNRKKYSCCLYDQAQTLDEAEVEALRMTCEHAELTDGIKILELGCGWGSLTLWMAEQYPDSEITAVSNSASQREFILRQAQVRGIAENLTVITADMNDFDTDEKFDRVVSVEMFEHMRNHERLLSNISRWLKSDGKLFVHIFCNKEFTYSFEVEGASNWMGRYFFTGGIMPGENLFAQYDQDLEIEQQWKWNGVHYEKTSNHWLENLDGNYHQVLDVMERVYGAKEGKRWLNRWRVFFMACAELFGMEGGDQWYVAHYLFRPTQVEAPNEKQLAASHS